MVSENDAPEEARPRAPAMAAAGCGCRLVTASSSSRATCLAGCTSTGGAPTIMSSRQARAGGIVVSMVMHGGGGLLMHALRERPAGRPRSGACCCWCIMRMADGMTISLMSDVLICIMHRSLLAQQHA